MASLRQLQARLKTNMAGQKTTLTRMVAANAKWNDLEFRAYQLRGKPSGALAKARAREAMESDARLRRLFSALGAEERRIRAEMVETVATAKRATRARRPKTSASASALKAKPFIYPIKRRS